MSSLTILLITITLTTILCSCPFMTINSEQVCTLEDNLSIGNDVTINGCRCISACGTSINDGYNCEWCYTADNCGKKDQFGKSFDHCIFDEEKEFELQTVDSKMAYLWKKVTEDSSKGKYLAPPRVFAEGIQSTFDNLKDVLPVARKKLIHSQGIVAKFKFVAESDSPYTGILRANAESFGLIRLGAAAPVNTLTGIAAPGMGIKFLRKNKRSANIVGLGDIDSYPKKVWDFFEIPISNRVTKLAGLLKGSLKIKSLQATQMTNMVGLSDLCRYDAAGEEAAAINFPFALEFQRSNPNMKVDLSKVSSFSRQSLQDQMNDMLLSVMREYDTSDLTLLKVKSFWTYMQLIVLHYTI